MARLAIAPTKSNLMAVKGQLAVARDGYDLLEQKREILVMELMDRLAEVKQLERDIARRQDSAYPALRETLFRLGRENADAFGRDVVAGTGLTERRIVIAGIGFSVLDTTATAPERGLPPSVAAVGCDRTFFEFSELLVLLARMASLRSVVVRLALEVKKTQRRVNALEKMVIPQTLETKLYIENVLEEQDREAFFVRKLLKTRG